MKFTTIITALTMASAIASAAPQQPQDVQKNPASSNAISTYEKQIGFQRRLILEEKAALDHAIETRNNQVHIGQDLLNTLAYGVATGALTYDFLKGTQNLQAVRQMFVSKKVPGLAPTETPIASPAERAATAGEKAVVASSPRQAQLLRKVGTVAYRTTELASAAALGVVLVGDVYQTGKDISIRFSDTDEIREHKAKLVEAEKNLDVADQNLQVAVLAEQM